MATPRKKRIFIVMAYDGSNSYVVAAYLSEAKAGRRAVNAENWRRSIERGNPHDQFYEMHYRPTITYSVTDMTIEDWKGK